MYINFSFFGSVKSHIFDSYHHLHFGTIKHSFQCRMHVRRTYFDNTVLIYSSTGWTFYALHRLHQINKNLGLSEFRVVSIISTSFQLHPAGTLQKFITRFFINCVLQYHHWTWLGKLPCVTVFPKWGKICQNKNCESDKDPTSRLVCGKLFRDKSSVIRKKDFRNLHGKFFHVTMHFQTFTLCKSNKQNPV